MTTLHVLPDGTLKGLYTEALDLNTLGLLEVKRALAIESIIQPRSGACSIRMAAAFTTLPHGRAVWPGSRNT